MNDDVDDKQDSLYSFSILKRKKKKPAIDDFNMEYCGNPVSIRDVMAWFAWMHVDIGRASVPPKVFLYMKTTANENKNKIPIEKYAQNSTLQRYQAHRNESHSTYEHKPVDFDCSFLIDWIYTEQKNNIIMADHVWAQHTRLYSIAAVDRRFRTVLIYLFFCFIPLSLLTFPLSHFASLSATFRHS